ncbi:MAG: Mur ligase family protein [Rhizobiaceae bacterium]
MTDRAGPPRDSVEDALTIPIPTSKQLVLDDARRLTGPGMLWDYPGAALDVSFSMFDPEQIISIWDKHARRTMDAVGWGGEQITSRRFSGGINFAISAPMDQLYSAIFVAQTAWHFCATQILDQPSGNFEAMIGSLKTVMAREANPDLIALIDAADMHKIDILCDDDEISLGHGDGSKVWPVNKLPTPNAVDWDALHNIPVALITGTNGKTTTTRLCAAIAKAARKVAGLTSTDFVRVGDTILDHGDYSGPGGARMLLRDKRTEIAYLEVARGGILRRGLPVRHAAAALVTNVAADHLGEYGVNTVKDLALAKFAVHRTLAHNGVLVLNADDKYVVAQAELTPSKICWFSLNPKSEQILQAKRHAHACAWFDGRALVYFDGTNTNTMINVADIPITMKGAAHYNIRNALGALCLSKAMGLGNDAIIIGLSSFKNNQEDNPGRCNEFEINGARVFVDFAHNLHSISAVTQALGSVTAARIYIMISHAGDRSNEDIRAVTESVFKLNPDIVVAAEVVEYLRGRELGEVCALTMDVCVKQGLAKTDIMFATSPANGVAYILRKLQPGDMALLLVLSERDKIFELLSKKNW